MMDRTWGGMTNEGPGHPNDVPSDVSGADPNGVRRNDQPESQSEAGERLRVNLRHAQAGLASSKYAFSSLAAASFAVAVLTADAFFVATGGVFVVAAFLFVIVQNGLLRRARWARAVAIFYSCLQLFSVVLPIALISLRGLLSAEVRDGFRESVPPPARVWHSHLRALILASAVFSLLLATGLLRREWRVRHGLSLTRPHVTSDAARPILPRVLSADR